jgi:hypothetical protein
MLELQKELDRFRKRVMDSAKQNLRNDKKRVTNKLYNSIKSYAKVSKNSFELGFSLGDYGQFVDQGVKGANPNGSPRWRQKAPNSPFKFKSSKTSINTQSLGEWMKLKGIHPKKLKGNKAISQNSLKYLIGRSIHGQGIKPSLFFTKAFEKEFKNLSNDIVKAYGLDVEDLLKYSLNGK